MTAPSSFAIARPGWIQEREIPSSPPDCSWRTDAPGSFSAVVDTKELARFGYPAVGLTGALGKWIWYEHPTAGAWGGVITGTSTSGAFTTINGEDFGALLRKRIVSSNWRSLPTSPGTAALLYLTSAERSGESMMLTGYQAEEGGETFPWEPRSGDLCDDLLPELAALGYQWHVISRTRAERLFEFRRRLGTDKRRSVLLSDGRHIVAESVQIDSDLWTVLNAIEGIPADQNYTAARGYVLENQASIRDLGRRYQGQIVYNGVGTRSTIAPLVKKDLAAYAYPTTVATLDIMDADDCWRLFREGDTITVALEAAGLQVPMAIDVRSLSASTATLTISGELLIGQT